MRSPPARWFVLLLIALLPAQVALAAGGALCAIGHRTHDTMVSVSHSHSGAAYGAPAQKAQADAQPIDNANAKRPSGERPNCRACAPGCGSPALSGVPPLALAAIAGGDDFLPILVVLRPVRSNGLERPPRTI